MQRFCETIENSLNIYKALAKRRQGSVAGKEWGGLGLDKGFVYIREIFSLCFLFSFFLPTNFPHIFLTAPEGVWTFSHISMWWPAAAAPEAVAAYHPEETCFAAKEIQNAKTENCKNARFINIYQSMRAVRSRRAIAMASRRENICAACHKYEMFAAAK